jgi:hypothetical protein
LKLIPLFFLKTDIDLRFLEFVFFHLILFTHALVFYQLLPSLRS